MGSVFAKQGTALEAGIMPFPFPMGSLDFYLLQLSGLIMELGSTQTPTEMSTRGICWG